MLNNQAISQPKNLIYLIKDLNREFFFKFNGDLHKQSIMAWALQQFLPHVGTINQRRQGNFEEKLQSDLSGWSKDT